jgi:uncharacterized protein YbjT (DUF2867 family)
MSAIRKYPNWVATVTSAFALLSHESVSLRQRQARLVLVGIAPRLPRIFRFFRAADGRIFDAASAQEVVTMPGKTIAVIGATGQQGGQVARHLLKDGWVVRALTRDPDKPAAKALAGEGAEVVMADNDDRQSLVAAFRDAYGVFSVQNFWLPNVGKEGEIRHGKLAADVAKAAGVEHFVYSSVGAAHRGMGQAHFASKWQIEQYIQSLGLPYTIVRPVAFMDNFNWSRPAITNGKFPSRGVRPEKATQLVAADDIGLLVAHVFAHRDQYLGKTIELAGDELTEQQIAETFAKVISRPVKIVPQQMPEGYTPTAEQSAMFKFFNGQGYDADIAALRSELPQLQTFEQYLRRHGWENAEPMPETEQRPWGS